MTDTVTTSLIVVGVLAVILGVLRLRHVSLQGLVLGLIATITGLLVGALASVPLSKLPAPFGAVMPVATSVFITLVLVGVMLTRRQAMLGMLPFLRLEGTASAGKTSAESAPSATGITSTQTTAPAVSLPPILVDTSVIIDGRIADIATAGFVPGRLVVPRFVLAELQNIADSDDAMRRGRGRRGLDVLNRLRETEGVDVEIIEDDVQGVREVDAKLVALAQKFTCNVLTTDYNLNRVAQIQGVRVLNVNELSNAIRPVVLPGEELIVRVVQPGKERNQGVGYLADGTMIVVENGDKLIGQDVSTEVTRVFQTVAGKMIFAVPRHMGSNHQATHQATPPAAEKPVAPATPAPEPALVPKTPAARPVHQPTAPGAQAQAPRDNKQHFGRSRRRGSGNATAQQPGTTGRPRRDDIEGRIIAATNAPATSAPATTTPTTTTTKPVPAAAPKQPAPQDRTDGQN